MDECVCYVGNKRSEGLRVSSLAGFRLTRGFASHVDRRSNAKNSAVPERCDSFVSAELHSHLSQHASCTLCL